MESDIGSSRSTIRARTPPRDAECVTTQEGLPSEGNVELATVPSEDVKGCLAASGMFGSQTTGRGIGHASLEPDEYPVWESQVNQSIPEGTLSHARLPADLTEFGRVCGAQTTGRGIGHASLEPDAPEAGLRNVESRGGERSSCHQNREAGGGSSRGWPTDGDGICTHGVLWSACTRKAEWMVPVEGHWFSPVDKTKLYSEPTCGLCSQHMYTCYQAAKYSDHPYLKSYFSVSIDFVEFEKEGGLEKLETTLLEIDEAF